LEIDSAELSDYIHAVLEGIDTGISNSNRILASPVKFQIGVRNVVEQDDFIRIEVAGFGRKHSEIEHARVEFEVTGRFSKAVKDVYDDLNKRLAEGIKNQLDTAPVNQS
jgi:hypothetical protein